MMKLNITYDISAERLVHEKEMREKLPLMRRAGVETLYIFGYFYGHFASSEADMAEASLEASIRTHLARFGDDDRCYSESTVYPANALSPENWIRKMEIEIRCGLRNLFLMSGTWFFSDPYWEALMCALPRLRELADTPAPAHEERAFIWQID